MVDEQYNAVTMAKGNESKDTNVRVIRQRAIEITEDEHDKCAVELESGAKVAAKKSVLLATGAKPDLSAVPVITDNARPNCIVLRPHDDYHRLQPQLDRATQSIAVYGNGLRAYQVSLAIAQEKPGVAVRLLDPDTGALSRHFPSYLAKYIEKRLKSKGVKYQGFKAVKISSGPQGVRIISADGREVDCNILVLDAPCVPRTISIRKKDGEPVDTHSGVPFHSSMQCRPSIYAAGHVLLAQDKGYEDGDGGHAKHSGRIAGLGMTGAKEALQHGTHSTDGLRVSIADIHLAGVGRIDNQLSTIGLWESDKDGADDPEYRRGAILYYDDPDRIVKGVLLVNLGADRIDTARQLLDETLPGQFSGISSTLLNK